MCNAYYAHVRHGMHGLTDDGTQKHDLLSTSLNVPSAVLREGHADSNELIHQHVLHHK